MENEEKPFNASGCCGAGKFLAEVYLWVERPAPIFGHGRRLIAEAVCCNKCLRQAGDLKILPEAPKEFNGTVWSQMQNKTGGDKFYCEFRDGKLVPFGGKAVKAALPPGLQKFSPQELAANEGH